MKCKVLISGFVYQLDSSWTFALPRSPSRSVPFANLNCNDNHLNDYSDSNSLLVIEPNRLNPTFKIWMIFSLCGDALTIVFHSALLEIKEFTQLTKVSPLNSVLLNSVQIQFMRARISTKPISISVDLQSASSRSSSISLKTVTLLIRFGSVRAIFRQYYSPSCSDDE